MSIKPHCLIIRAHTDGVVSGGNIARFDLPNVVGTKTLATTEDVSAAVPSGAVMYFATANAPAGWLKANGAAVSRTAYAALFAAIGTRFGAGNGSTTFNLPDLRGEFVRGWDDGRGADGGRGLGNWQSDAIRNITGSIPTASWRAAEGDGAFRRSHMGEQDGDGSGSNGWIYTFDASRVVPTAHENRPRNLALLACIKI